MEGFGQTLDDFGVVFDLFSRILKESVLPTPPPWSILFTGRRIARARGTRPAAAGAECTIRRAPVECTIEPQTNQGARGLAVPLEPVWSS